MSPAFAGRKGAGESRIVTIPHHNPVDARTMAGIVRDAGISEPQFLRLL